MGGTDWYFTRKTDSIFSLKLLSNTEIKNFYIASIDNYAKNLPLEGSKVTLIYKNSDGKYSSGDEFEGFQGACDLSCAKISVPFVNTAPIIFWGL